MKTPSTSRLARPVSLCGIALLTLMALGMAAPASPHRVPGGLKGRWKVDEGTGTSAADSSGTGNSGTLTNGVAWTTGKAGGALSFDGVDDYVSCGVTGMPAANAAQTISWWLNVASNPSGTQSIISLTNDASSSAVQPGFRGGNIAVWKYGGGVLVQAAPPAAGLWHHYAYTFDGTTHRLYVNGTQVNTSTVSPQTATPNALNFGRWTGGTEYLAGKLDEVRIYSRTLTASEILGLAHDPSLEALVKFDEGTGTTASDNSGMGHDGTLNNGATWATGQSGNALSLDGTDDNVSLSLETGLPANNASQTVANWMNVASNPSGTQCAVDLHNDGSASALQIGFRNGNVTAWNHGGNVLAQETPPSAGSWHHVAYTYDGTTHTLYIDGVSAGTSTASPQTAAVTSFVLGRWNGGPGEYFAGKLDELRVYSRTLSATEIAGLAGGNGTGLSAVYYDNMDFTGSFIQRTDATVNFNWGTGSPDAAIGADTFSVLWTGQVQPQWSETYTFYTNTDDGVKLWVNGQLIVDYPQNQSATEHSGSITLSGGVKYDLRMEYFENGGDARAELRWSSGSTPKAIIPQSQLYPTDSVTPALLNATSATGDLTHVYLRFNEAMNAATATTAGNYTLSGGLTVSSATISSDKKVVTVTASGNVTLGTTTVTASASVKNLEQEAIVQTTKTIVAGNGQGMPDSTAITIIMTTDNNHSTVMFNEPSSHGVSQGVGEMFRLEAPGTSPTTITLRQTKKLGGTGRINFDVSGEVAAQTVTTSGGSPNKVIVDCRHANTSAFEGDLVVEAVVSGEVRGTKDVTAVELSFSTKYAYTNDQAPFTNTAQVTPAIQNLTLTNTTFAMDFGGSRDGTTPTTLLQMQAWSLTNGSGQATRTYSSPGVNAFLYDVIQLDRPMIALFGTIDGAKYCNKWKIIYTCYNSYEVEDTGDTSVKLSDGEKKLQFRDLIIKGRGFDFGFGRQYLGNTLRQQLATASGGKVVQDFGVNWTYTYADDYLIKDGTGSEDSSNYVIYRSDQISSLFVNVGTGTWVAGQDEFSRLRKNASGDFEIRNSDGMIRTFHNFQTGTSPNKNGRLNSIEDRNGNRMTFFYEQIDPDNTVSGDDKYVLAYAVDTLGREIRYQYFAKTAQTVGGRTLTITSTNAGALGRLAKVIDFKDNMTFSASPTQTQDFAGQTRNRTLSFGYDSEGNLVKAGKPAVTATLNGNDFSSGKAVRYRYYTATQHPGFTQTQWDALTQTQRDRLLHKLTHIWYPNEVKDQVDTDPADSDAAEVIIYETTTSSRFYGYATSYTVGGQNGNGVPSGGTITYTHTDLDSGRSLVSHPYNGFQIASHKTAITDRNGNQAEYVFSAEKTLMSYKEFPRGLRSGEPANFENQEVWNGQTLLRGDRLKSQRTQPEGDLIALSYNDATSDRYQQANRIRKTLTPDSRGGDQTAIETVSVYEPIYNQPWLQVSARGSNSSSNGFTPPISDPASRTITDPYDASRTINLRYAAVSFFDYQESTLASTAWSGTSSWTPTTVDSVTVKATEVLLVRKLGLPDGNDTDRANSIRELRNRLSANLVKLGLGDLNGDGNTDPVASGNVIRTAYGSPVLLANTNQHKLEGNIETAGDLIDQTKNVVDGGTQEGSNGARLQTIVWMYQYNGFGQMTKTISPEGNVTAYAYFAENDPDGDAIATPTPADGRTLDTTAGAAGGGYLRDVTQDTTRSYYQQTTGTLLSGGFSDNNTNPATTDIKASYTYDDVGNAVTVINGRGIRTDYFVNELNQILQTTGAADVSGSATASPSDPLYNHSDTQQRLTAFAYKSRAFFDYNNRVVLSQIEDRGNTSGVDGSGLGSLPSQATGTTPGLSSADSSGGDSYVDTLTLYDRLNDRIEIRMEVDSTRSLVTRYRYDGNQHLVFTIYPEGNADSSVYDERDLLFQLIRGASSRPSAGMYASGDPTSFNRPGGSGCHGR
jgi:YD repeat-containing protein